MDSSFRTLGIQAKMASTGVSVADASIAQFNEFKKSSNPILFLIFKIANGSIVTEHTSSETANFQDFIALLPSDDCRYGVYKMDYTTNDGRPASKLVSIAW